MDAVADNYRHNTCISSVQMPYKLRISSVQIPYKLHILSVRIPCRPAVIYLKAVAFLFFFYVITLLAFSFLTKDSCCNLVFHEISLQLFIYAIDGNSIFSEDANKNSN